MRNFLRNLLQLITGKPRYECHGEWDYHCWIANVFRFWEYLCGREVGIRREASTSVTFIDGQRVVKRKFYTLEAFLAHYECTFRLYLKKCCTLSFSPEERYAFQRGAIGFDASAVGTTTATSPITGTHTCTGSNLMLAVGVGNTATSPTISTPTYNSVSMSLVGSQQTNVANMAAMYFLVAPTTGSNTVSIAFGGTTPDCNYNSVSYTGVKQSGQPDASGGTTGAGSPNPNWNTVADNCWAVCVLSGISVSGGNQHALGGVLTLSGTHQMEVQDHNSPIHPAGNITFAWQAGTTTWAAEGGSFSPVVVAGGGNDWPVFQNRGFWNWRFTP